MQKWYKPAVSSCQVWWHSDFACCQGAKKFDVFLSCQDSLVCLIFPIYAPHMRPVHPLFLIFPLVYSLPHLLLFFLLFPFPFLIRFTCFLLLSIPSLFSARVVPLHFQAGGHRRRPNLGLVCLWSPYVIRQTIYIFILFLSSSSSFFFFFLA